MSTRAYRQGIAPPASRAGKFGTPGLRFAQIRRRDPVADVEPVFRLHAAAIAASKQAIVDLDAALKMAMEAKKKVGQESPLDILAGTLATSLRDLMKVTSAIRGLEGKGVVILHEESLSAADAACASIAKAIVLTTAARTAASGFGQASSLSLGYRLRLNPMVKVLGAAIGSISFTVRMAKAISSTNRRAVMDLIGSAQAG